MRSTVRSVCCAEAGIGARSSGPVMPIRIRSRAGIAPFLRPICGESKPLWEVLLVALGADTGPLSRCVFKRLRSLARAALGRGSAEKIGAGARMSFQGTCGCSISQGCDSMGVTQCRSADGMRTGWEGCSAGGANLRLEDRAGRATGTTLRLRREACPAQPPEWRKSYFIMRLKWERSGHRRNRKTLASKSKMIERPQPPGNV
jgi:hypothetical protein